MLRVNYVNIICYMLTSYIDYFHQGNVKKKKKPDKKSSNWQKHLYTFRTTSRIWMKISGIKLTKKRIHVLSRKCRFRKTTAGLSNNFHKSVTIIKVTLINSIIKMYHLSKEYILWSHNYSIIRTINQNSTSYIAMILSHDFSDFNISNSFQI